MIEWSGKICINKNDYLKGVENIINQLPFIDILR